MVFSHPEAAKLIIAYPYVLVMDCTYKTNRYGLPFLEAVGMTSTNMTFTIAYVFLRNEKEKNFRWALAQIRALYEPGVLPSVIVTDRELGLINAVEKEFPEAHHMLCRRHIEMALRARALKVAIQNKEKFANSVVFTWNEAISAHTVEEWMWRWHNFEDKYFNLPQPISYLKQTWLDPYNRRLCRCGLTSISILVVIPVTDK